jgi:hypothetical protein
MRNIPEKEREKIMIGGFHSGGAGGDYRDPEEQREQLQQEIRRDANAPTAKRVFYIVVASVLLLFLMVMIVGANVFHW